MVDMNLFQVHCIHMYIPFAHSQFDSKRYSFLGLYIRVISRITGKMLPCLAGAIDYRTTHISLSPGFVNYKKGTLDSQPQVIKFTSCLPMVGFSLISYSSKSRFPCMAGFLYVWVFCTCAHSVFWHVFFSSKLWSL
jgi:hypothetical protein